MQGLSQGNFILERVEAVYIFEDGELVQDGGRLAHDITAYFCYFGGAIKNCLWDGLMVAVNQVFAADVLIFHLYVPLVVAVQNILNALTDKSHIFSWFYFLD